MPGFRSYAIATLGFVSLFCLMPLACVGEQTQQKGVKHSHSPTDDLVKESSLDTQAEPFSERSSSQNISDGMFTTCPAEGLSLEKAVQLALVNNHELLAFYENLALGHADLIEAGLQKNPSFFAANRIPDEEGSKVNQIFDMSINYLDYFLIPFRQNAAAADLAVIEAQVSQKVLDVVKEVSIDWIIAKAKELSLLEEAERIELRDVAQQLAMLQQKAGNISELNERRRKLSYQEAVLQFKNLLAEREVAREKLNRSLGLFDIETCFELAGDLDWQKDAILAVGIVDIENAALNNRWDVEAARREVYAIAAEAKLKEPWTYANISVGISSERDPDGLMVIGPSVELENPVFNYGQGEMVKYQALLEQAQQKLLAKAVDVCSRAREFHESVAIYQSQLEDLEQKTLPDLAQQVVDGMAQYNVMTIGLFELLDLKEKEIQGAIDRIHALKNYLIAQIELVHATGGSFSLLRSRK